jgi:hypothetical protein
MSWRFVFCISKRPLFSLLHLLPEIGAKNIGFLWPWHTSDKQARTTECVADFWLIEQDNYFRVHFRPLLKQMSFLDPAGSLVKIDLSLKCYHRKQIKVVQIRETPFLAL